MIIDITGKTQLRARKNNRRTRAFGEMVAILWEQGHHDATLELEHLWDNVCKEESLGLFCAYPQLGFTCDIDDHSIDHICKSHSRMIRGTDKPMAELLYKITV